MKYLHAMIRVSNLKESIRFYRDLLGLELTRQKDYVTGRFSLYYFSSGPGEPEIELTHNWDSMNYTNGSAFGHLAFQVENIYAVCERLNEGGVAVLRPPRDGKMAFVKDPSGISIELLQAGAALPASEPSASMPSIGSW